MIILHVKFNRRELKLFAALMLLQVKGLRLLAGGAIGFVADIGTADARAST